MDQKVKLVISEENKLIKKKDIALLLPEDFVFLILSDGLKEERLWVKIIEKIGNEKGFRGEIANKPVVIKGVSLGDEIIFEDLHIVNFSTKAEQKRIVDEFNKTGNLPSAKVDVFPKEIKQNLAKLLELPKKYENGFKLLYKIRKSDRKFFENNIDEIIEKYDQELVKNPTGAKNAAEDGYKMFFSMVLIVILPQITENIDNGEIYDSVEAKKYYGELEEILDETKRLFVQIAPGQEESLVQLKEFFNDEELNKIEASDLADLFGAFIEEAILDIKKL